VAFEQIKDLIPKAIDRSGDPPALLASQVIALWPGVVKKVMPEKAQGKSRARKLTAGQLRVTVDSTLWAQEFKLHFPKLLKEMNRQAKRNVVRQIFFKLRR
jgi:predicted nucleic acid-binding Zn ribbon protein